VPNSFTIQRRVEFSETDLAGIVHFSNFLKYMESAEHAFLRSLGHSVVLRNVQPPMGFPRVHVDCDFKRPIRFEDLIEIQLLVVEKRPRSLRYQFRFSRIEPGPPERIALGNMAVVCVAKSPDGRFAPVPIPASLHDQIEVVPEADASASWLV